MITVSIRLEDDVKQDLDKMCDELGMNLSTFFTIYAKAALRERRIPFELALSKDPFYSESNIAYLEQIMKDVQTGKAHFSEHELIEAD